MVLAGYQFKPRLWAVAVTISLVLVFIELGKWQLSRAEERNARQEELDLLTKEPVVSIPGSPIKLKDFRNRQVEVVGRYSAEHTIYLDNKVYKGQAGYHVLTPLQIAHSDMYVMVNRGWAPTGYDRSILPEIPTSSKETTITGTVVSPELKTLELSGQSETGAVWDRFSLDRFRDMTGYNLQPIMIQQTNNVEDGLIRDWHKPGSGASKNIGYAIQWFSLAATTIIIFIILNVKRRNKKIK